MHRADFGRVMVLRTGNHSMQRPGHTAAESITAPYVGGLAALEAGYRVGSTVVHELIGNWSKWTSTFPATRPRPPCGSRPFCGTLKRVKHLLEWRNWQTHGTQNPAPFTGHVGSTPTSSTSNPKGLGVLEMMEFKGKDHRPPGPEAGYINNLRASFTENKTVIRLQFGPYLDPKGEPVANGAAGGPCLDPGFHVGPA